MGGILAEMQSFAPLILLLHCCLYSFVADIQNQRLDSFASDDLIATLELGPSDQIIL